MSLKLWYLAMIIPDRLRLAQSPTPIERLPRWSESLNKEIFVWRDDLTGSTLSGNKIRKLEFLLFEARARNARVIVTCGGVQSNHARATAWACRALGLECYLILREPPGGFDWNSPPCGNLLHMRLAGAKIIPLSYDTFASEDSYEPFLTQLSERLSSLGETNYVITEGGSQALGCFGYRTAVSECLETWASLGVEGSAPDQIFCALGSGGTSAGLMLGFQDHGLDPTRIHSVNVCNDRPYFQARLKDLFGELEDRFDVPSSDIDFQVSDGHVGGGYGVATDEELIFYAEVAREDGLLLDPCYTGKAFRGMIAEIRSRPADFGDRILFLHSGGLWSLDAYASDFHRLLPIESHESILHR